MKPWVVYTGARLGLFVGTLVILLLVGTGWIMGTIFATGISLALSVLFLGGLRQKVADGIRNRVEKPEKDEDASVEDEQLSRGNE
ncbi:MAG: hypothetical protein RLZ72_81 [Actinomycetota bacterium]|jgi:hypothetical protein